MTLVRTPADEVLTWPRLVDRFFGESFPTSRWFLRELDVPAVDVKATAEEIVVEAALPGVQPADVEVTVDGDVLTLKGSFKQEESRDEAGYVYRELSRGAFSRSIALPTPVEVKGAKATFKDGMLHLTLPKANGVKPARIDVTAG